MAGTYEHITTLNTADLVSYFIECDELLEQASRCSGGGYDETTEQMFAELIPEHEALLAEIRRRDMLFKVPTTETERDDYERVAEWSCLDLVPAYKSLSEYTEEAWREYHLNGSRPDPYLAEWEDLVLSEIRRRDEAVGIVCEPVLSQEAGRARATQCPDYDEEVPF